MFTFPLLLQGAYLLAGLVFLYYGLSKVLTPGYGFAKAIHKYRILPSPVVIPFSKVLPMVEVVVGLALFLPSVTYFAAPMLVALMVMFEIAVAKALITGLKIDCGCRGEIKGEKANLAVAFGRNILLIGFLTSGWYFGTTPKDIFPFAVLAVSLVILGVVNYVIAGLKTQASTDIVSIDNTSQGSIQSRRGFMKVAGVLGLMAGLAVTARAIPAQAASCTVWCRHVGTYNECGSCNCGLRCMICYGAVFDLWLLCDEETQAVCGQLRAYTGIYVYCCQGPCP